MSEERPTSGEDETVAAQVRADAPSETSGVVATEATAEPESVSDLEHQPDVGIEPDVEPAVDLESDVEPDADVVVVVDADTETAADVDIVTADAEVKTDVEPVVEIEAGPVNEAGAVVEADTDAQPSTEVEAEVVETVVADAAPVSDLDEAPDSEAPESESAESASPEFEPPGSEVSSDGDPSEVAPGSDPGPELGGGERLRPALEAILLVVDEPVADVMLAQILERPREEIVATLEELSAEYTEQGRGFDLRRAAGGWRLYTRGEFAAYVERFVLDGQQARLTQAALETLAVIAYKQPVSRSRISAIRGVAVDGVIRTLLTRGLIEEAGVEPETGAHLYVTTGLFLEKLGLDSLDELPKLAPLLPEMDTLDDVIAST